MSRFASLVAVLLALPAPSFAADPKDWASYNGSPAGWRLQRGRNRDRQGQRRQARREVAVPREGRRPQDRLGPRDARRG